MKEPKGFASFLGEEKKKPAKKKTSPKKKSRKESNGKDDQKYISLMDEYKRTRRDNPSEASKVHKAAIKLKEDGDVSQNAVTAGQYI